MTKTSAKLYCLGEALFELSTVDHYYYAGGIGGDVSNCAIAAARSGADVGLITRLGDDLPGKHISKFWRGEGIDTSFVSFDRSANTGVYIIEYCDGNHIFHYLRRNSAASRMTPGDLDAIVFDSSTILHVSGISHALSKTARTTVDTAICKVKEAGGKLSYDTNLRLKLWSLEHARESILHAAAVSDFLFPSLEDAVQLLGMENPDQIADEFLALGAGCVALTLGPEGALIASSKERKFITTKAVTAVDATGAGDTFDGAFLAEFLKCGDIFEAGRYANAAASISVMKRGAITSIPSRHQVKAVLLS